MRYFWNVKQFPDFSRVLLVESGTRGLVEKVIPFVEQIWRGKLTPMDLFTCYEGVPEGIGEDGNIYRSWDYPKGTRKQLIEELKTRKYGIVGIVCSEEPILFQWKLLIAASLPAKILIINECGDCFWFDRDNWSAIKVFALSRSGITGATVLRSVVQLFALPVSIPFLVLFAVWAHATRLVAMPRR